MTRTRIFWLAALAFSSLAFGAWAQDIQTPAPATTPGPSAETPPAGDRVDRNNDGKITKAEARTNPELARRFKSLDIDNSGKLDSAEFARFELGDEPAQVPADPY